jgi:glycine C-acetyltransferase
VSVHARLREILAHELAGIQAAGTWKRERPMAGPQGPEVRLADGSSVLVLCSNDYLGLAQHPEVTGAARRALDDWGYGLASVRFICGTQTLHQTLETRLSAFLGTEETILYGSCFDANTGLFETLLGPEDSIISDELNHASLIDGIRLCKAGRLRYRHDDLADLETRLREAAGARLRLIVTDGVFSMDGHIARLPAICDLAEAHDALVMVDDSHGVGVLGAHGRGTLEHHGVIGRIDILTGTLGKALGGASGGYTSGSRELIALLRQRSRPYLFSNTVPPPIVAGAIAALDVLGRSTALRDRLAANTAFFRAELGALGFEVLPGEHPIVPLMLGDAALATRFADALLERGLYVVGFSHPVVPAGKARLRLQVSAAHTEVQLATALSYLGETRRALGL